MNSVEVGVLRRPEGWECRVEVDHEGRRTRHAVRVSPADMQRWGGGDSDAHVEDLVRRSFEFLLEREPASAILRSFDLSLIEDFFPDYDQSIRR